MVRISGTRLRGCGLGLAALFLMVQGAAGPAGAQAGPTIVPRDDVALDQRLNNQVPLDIPFRDDSGKVVPLSTFFGKRPVILQMPFYRCPGICTLEMDGMTHSIRYLSYNPGTDYDIVEVSINPKETPELAAAKKAEFIKLYGRPKTAAGWHFLTGNEASIKRLAAAVGFKYVYDVKTDQYIHPAGLMVLTPEGKLSRYFYGAGYRPQDLKFALIDASAHKIGSPVDQILLMCYHYDPIQGRYGVAVINILKVAGTATLLILIASIVLMERMRAKSEASSVRYPKAVTNV